MTWRGRLFPRSAILLIMRPPTRAPSTDLAAARTVSAYSTSPLAIILDIDHTLIDAHCYGTVIVKRPGVDAFLDALFANCSAVALWTNASASWADAVVNVLTHDGGKPRNWAFVWNCQHSTPIFQSIQSLDGSCGQLSFHGAIIGRQKRLQKVWRSADRRAQGFTPARTVIIDDTPLNCTRNFGNAIYVPPFDAACEADAACARDVTLPSLARYLAHLRATAANVRTVEKREWLACAADLERNLQVV